MISFYILSKRFFLKRKGLPDRRMYIQYGSALLFEHQHDIIYQEKCSAKNCLDDYIGELAIHIIERVKGHGGRDTKSRALQHNSEKVHVEVTQEDFKVIGKHFKNKRLKRKIADALLIKQEHPSLNAQDQSVDLKLLN